MKRIVILLIFSTIISTCNISQVYCYDMKQVFAYPVPFKPSVHSELTIQNLSTDPIVCSVYDINGDLVRTIKSTGNATWNGRNGSGRVVKPGLYIIKVEIEGDNGNYGKKMIRIIVQ